MSKSLRCRCQRFIFPARWATHRPSNLPEGVAADAVESIVAHREREIEQMSSPPEDHAKAWAVLQHRFGLIEDGHWIWPDAWLTGNDGLIRYRKPRSPRLRYAAWNESAKDRRLFGMSARPGALGVVCPICAEFTPLS